MKHITNNTKSNIKQQQNKATNKQKHKTHTRNSKPQITSRNTQPTLDRTKKPKIQKQIAKHNTTHNNNNIKQTTQ